MSGETVSSKTLSGKTVSGDAPAPHVVCDRLVKIFRVGASEVVALQGLEFAVEAGEMVGVVGASGSGKSTLLSVLGGLTSPTAGRVEVGGIDLASLGPADLARYRREQVGFVWQRTAANLLPHLSAAENIAVPLTIGANGNRRSRRARCEELLDLVGLGDRGGHRPVELSGGEQQRVAIAVALAAEPSLLLADEPTGELDSETADAIYELLRSLNRELRLTQLIVSHDPEIATRVDRVVAVSDGQLASERRARTSALDGDTTSDELVTDEVLLVDGQGRLQLPAAALDALGIEGRVTAEVVDGAVRLTKPREPGEEAPDE